MTTIVVVRRLAEEGPGDETGGTANITTSAQAFKPLPAACGTILNQSPENVMTAKRAAGYCGGALLMLAWLSSAGGLMRQTTDEPAPRKPVDTAGTIRLADEVQAQTGRLKSRLAVAPAPQEPFRNPFTFAARAVPERREANARVEGETPAPNLGPPLEPAIELIGVAESESAERRRTHRHHLGARRRAVSREGRGDHRRALSRRSGGCRCGRAQRLADGSRPPARLARVEPADDRPTIRRPQCGPAGTYDTRATRASLTAAAARISGSALASPASSGAASTFTTPTAPASSRPSAKLAMLTPCRPRIDPI